MHTLWNADDRASIIDRMARLSPSATPAWGSFDAPRMLAHVTDALRMATGDLEVAPRSGPLSIWPLNSLVMFYLPWPKSAPTAPEIIARSATDWAAGIQELRATLERFAARDRSGAWPAHPVFGEIGGEGWGRLGYRHVAHHLTQFRG
ncbi:MAG: DUF1569 domain-containing protein [Vicinamibacterales bacterium]